MTDKPTVRTEERRRHGRRLEELVRDRWRDPRGIRGLSEDLDLSRATLYSWFRGNTSPDTGSLTRLARLLLVSPSEVLTAIEGTDQSARLDERIRAVAHETVRAYVTPGTDEQARMLARAPASWRGASAAPAMRSELRHQRLSNVAGQRTQMAMRLLLDVIGPQAVESCDADDPVGPVARRLYEGDFSQLPVRDGDTWIGLLTNETIARWAAARSGRGLGYDETTPVREVLPYAEDSDNFRVVGRGATGAEVLQLFDDFAAEGRLLGSVLLTPTGRPREELLRIVTAFDLPALRIAIGR